MSRRSSKTVVVPNSKASQARIILLAVVAGAIGAGVTWWLLPSRPGPPPSAQAPVDAPEPPPSVAGLSPEKAALLLGHWHYDRQRWSAAAEQYETALRLGADNPDARTDLGNCYRFLSLPEKAREQYELSQRQNPQHEESLFNLAALYAQDFHDPTKARELLNEYLRRFPNSDGAAQARQLLTETDGSKLPPEKERLLRTLANDGHASGK